MHGARLLAGQQNSLGVQQQDGCVAMLQPPCAALWQSVCHRQCHGTVNSTSNVIGLLCQHASGLTALLAAGCVCREQGKALTAWKTTPRPQRPVELAPHERNLLNLQHERRLYEITTKQCMQVVRSMMTHNVSILLVSWSLVHCK